MQNSLQCIENPIAPQRLRKLQQQDSNIEILKRKLQNNRLDKEYYSLDENELLTRKVIDGGHEFYAIYLTQPHTMTIDGKSTTTDHPVAFVSGLFRGSQLNWAALMKEAFAIYMSVKKLSFYLTDAQILLRSDHKPLEKFLLKNTLNSKVNNWAMELEAFNIQFDYIK